MPIVCDTEAVRTSERRDYWRNVVCERYVTASSHNKSPGPFNARLTSVELGQFGSGALVAPPHCWSRDTRQIRADGREEFLLSMVVDGQGPASARSCCCGMPGAVASRAVSQKLIGSSFFCREPFHRPGIAARCQ